VNPAVCTYLHAKMKRQNSSSHVHKDNGNLNNGNITKSDSTNNNNDIKTTSTTDNKPTENNEESEEHNRLQKKKRLETLINVVTTNTPSTNTKSTFTVSYSFFFFFCSFLFLFVCFVVKENFECVTYVSDVVACYICRSPDIPGKFDPKKAKALGVPVGPMFGMHFLNHIF
jgi:hypothetical protein